MANVLRRRTDCKYARLPNPVPSRPLIPITMMSNTCTIKYRFTMRNQMVRLPEKLYIPRLWFSPFVVTQDYLLEMA